MSLYASAHSFGVPPGGFTAERAQDLILSDEIATSRLLDDIENVDPELSLTFVSDHDELD